MTEALGFTLVAIALYLVSDWLLQRAEIHAGRRFARRSLVFFGILLMLSVSVFALLRQVLA